MEIIKFDPNFNKNVHDNFNKNVHDNYVPLEIEADIKSDFELSSTVPLVLFKKNEKEIERELLELAGSLKTKTFVSYKKKDFERAILFLEKFYVYSNLVVAKDSTITESKRANYEEIVKTALKALENVKQISINPRLFQKRAIRAHLQNLNNSTDNVIINLSMAYANVFAKQVTKAEKILKELEK